MTEENTIGAKSNYTRAVAGGDAAVLLAQSKGSREFLKRALELFAEKYQSDKCMFFLYNDTTRQLSLKVSIGYPMSDQATIVMKLGEGLAGRALAERRTIYTEMASTMRGYLAHHHFPDDGYQTFLGIPLLRGKDRVGVIVLRRPTGTPFLAEEISSAKQKAADLASAIQNAGALLSLESARDDAEIAKKPFVVNEELALRGIAVSNGWGIGSAHIFYRNPSARVVDGKLPADHGQKAVRSIDEAVGIVEKNISEQTESLSERLPEAASLLFESAMMILNDENFIGKIKDLVNNGSDPVDAISAVSGEVIKLLEESTNDYFKEKALDVEDLAENLISAITENSPDQACLKNPHIVIAEKLLPSDVLRIAQGSVKGIVLVAGGVTAHISLLVRSMRIPMMIVSDRRLLRIPETQTVILDCANEFIFVNPTQERLNSFEMRRAAQAKDRISALVQPSEARTFDGVRIHLQANINLIADTISAKEVFAEGVGLYRTEFPFLMRQNLPSETEQKHIYSRMLSEMKGKHVTFRTLDAGGDKIIPYLFKTKEENPALGLRSMRLTLRFPYILDQQLRAILRAVQENEHEDVSIMFPMISSVEELKMAIERFNESVNAIHAEMGDRDLIIPNIGTMIEIPAAVAILDELAQYVDFFSIGTNDFIQYTLAVDRTNDNVNSYYIPHHPAILKSLKLISDAAIRNSIQVSVCGEMARDPRYMPFFIGIGIRSFSLEPAQIPNARDLTSRFTVDKCRQYAEDLLSAHLISDIESIMDEFTEMSFSVKN